jgi:hypothetical protein
LSCFLREEIFFEFLSCVVSCKLPSNSQAHCSCLKSVSNQQTSNSELNDVADALVEAELETDLIGLSDPVERKKL